MDREAEDLPSQGYHTGTAEAACAETQRTYDAIAARYAEFNARLPEGLAEASGRFLSMVTPGGRVLDAGCGHGRDMCWLEASGRPVTGMDLSWGMLQQARLVSVHLQQMDMRNLGYRDGSFAGIWCCASLVHLDRDQAPAALGELHRVLAPGGVLFLSVQPGEGVKWEECPYASGSRWYTRYSQEEMAALLTRSRFTIEHTGATDGKLRPWLLFYARRQASRPQEQA